MPGWDCLELKKFKEVMTEDTKAKPVPGVRARKKLKRSVWGRERSSKVVEMVGWLVGGSSSSSSSGVR